MPDEGTPLITTVAVGQPVRRYPHQTLRRFCTVALGSSLIAVLIVFLVTIVFDPTAPHRGGHRHRGRSPEDVTFEDLQRILLENPSSEQAEEWNRYYASGPHLAGKNISQAEWTRDRWEEWGLRSEIVAYDVYLNYPVDHRLALLKRGQSESEDASAWDVAYEAILEEDVLEEDPTTGLEDRVPTFHGYTGSGDVTGSFVYVNYGAYQDFEELIKANVSLEGRIAIARYGSIYRGFKVKRAQQLGMIGVILYSDPGDDGEVTEANGYDTYPNGPARNPSSVERGSIEFLNDGPGDPTTPGYPSKPGAPRQSVEGSVADIPSIPISYVDALPILKALNGYGPAARDINEHWTTNTGLGYKGVEYNIGPSPEGVVLNLRNEQEYKITPIWNVIGIINGTVPDEVVVVGNHRDSWIAGGAADPNSGSAVLNEVVRSFGVALEGGWKPLRTIVFASWDGEEYGLIGSTEWVEEYLPWLSAANVAYVNIDVGVSSPVFLASAAPLLHKLLYDVTALVQSPNQTVEGQTVRDVWDGEISTIGSGSDFTAFQDHAGIPSIDFGFGGTNKDSPVYMYHSNYDSFHWMATFGDPGFVYHKTMAQILGLTLAQLADAPLLALNATDYAVALNGYVKSIEDKLASLDMEPSSAKEISEIRARAAVTEVKGNVEDFKLSLAQLYDSIEQLNAAAVKLDARAGELAKEARENMPWWKLIKKLQLWNAIRSTNSKYKNIERAFVYEGGLDGRDWFKHVVFAPGLWTGYAGAVFPGLVESIDNKDFDNAEKWVSIIDNCIKTATKTIS